MKGILGYKLGMTRFYNEAGELVPVTVVQAGPCKVTAVMTQERHGYSALQLGVGNRRTKTMTKPILGHVKAAGFEEKMGPAELREIRLTEDAKQQVGDTVSADIFAEADYVDVTGISKGRGFAGVMKRHHFAGGRDSHGGGLHRGQIACGQGQIAIHMIGDHDQDMATQTLGTQQLHQRARLMIRQGD